MLNEKQFNLLKKVYPQAFQGASPSMQYGSAQMQGAFALHDPLLLIQFFANLKALNDRMLKEAAATGQ